VNKCVIVEGNLKRQDSMEKMEVESLVVPKRKFVPNQYVIN